MEEYREWALKNFPQVSAMLGTLLECKTPDWDKILPIPIPSYYSAAVKEKVKSSLTQAFITVALKMYCICWCFLISS